MKKKQDSKNESKKTKKIEESQGNLIEEMVKNQGWEVKKVDNIDDELDF
jgi:hypothetical protein